MGEKGGFMESDLNITKFAAREPSLGYFYQIRYGLYLLLSNRELNNPTLRIENLDDIEIQTVDGVNVFQTKLKMKSKANLTNASVDFWKTIRVWSEHIQNGRINPDESIFSLVTTESVAEGSFLFALRGKVKTDKEIEKIIDEMDKVATSSTNATLIEAFTAYLKLSIDQKKSMVNNICIVDAACDVDKITKKIRAELAFSSPPDKIDAFLEVLEGWWFQISIKHLIGEIDGIEFQSLQRRVSDIRDSFSLDNLPNEFIEQLEISDQEAKNSKDKTYLKQLELVSIEIASNTAKRAISDFRRAFEQRSKWLRLELLSPGEQIEYDQRLYDHWKNLFDILQDECLDAELDKLKEIGKSFYLNQFAKRCPPIRIREKFTEDYLVRGSYQMLADDKRIGWHPNYKEILE